MSEKAETPRAAPAFDVVIPAAGRGRRMGGRRKPHMQLAGRTILDHTLEVFLRTEGCGEIIPVLSPETYESGAEAERLREEFGIRRIACGGSSRQESAYAGLKMVREGSGLVLIHDAVRPLVESRTVLMVAQAARRWGGAVAAVPAVHTVKRVDAEGRVSGTPPREQLWFAHTPQGFRTDLILRAHREAEAEGFTGTDDAQLVERLGEEVRVVRDDRYNLKITTPEDLAIAEAIISWRAAHGGDSAAARDQSAGPRQS